MMCKTKLFKHLGPLPFHFLVQPAVALAINVVLVLACVVMLEHLRADICLSDSDYHAQSAPPISERNLHNSVFWKAAPARCMRFLLLVFCSLYSNAYPPQHITCRLDLEEVTSLSASCVLEVPSNVSCMVPK